MLIFRSEMVDGDEGDAQRSLELNYETVRTVPQWAPLRDTKKATQGHQEQDESFEEPPSLIVYGWRKY